MILQDKNIGTPIPMVLVGNKSDMEELREVSTWEGQQLAKRWGIPFLESSVKTGTGVHESFCELVREIRRALGIYKPPKTKLVKILERKCIIM